MAAVMFDTAEFVEELEKEGVERKQARAFVNVVRRSQEIVLVNQAKAMEGVSARTANELDSKTEHKIELLRKDLSAVEERLNGKMLNLEERLNSKIDKLETKVDNVALGLRKDLSVVEERLNGRMSSLETGLRKDMEALGNKLIIRLTLAMLGVLGVVGTIAGFVLRAMMMK